MSKLNSIIKFLILILLFDLVVILLHVLFSAKFTLFHLDHEQNLPTVYQSLKIIFIAFFVGIHIFLVKFIEQRNILPLSMLIIFFGIFLILGLDEVGQLHESVEGHTAQFFPQTNEEFQEVVEDSGFNSAKWLIYYTPIFLISSIFFVFIIKEYIKKKDNIVLFIIIGFSFFLIVPFIEFFNTQSDVVNSDKYNKLVIIEESVEMIGASFIITAFAIQMKKDSNYLKHLSIR